MAEPAYADDALEQIVVWEPRSKPQAALIACPVFEVFFGGSRGSLKTGSMLADWINHSSLYGEHASGLMVRRTREDLKSTVEEARQLYTRLGFKFSGHTCRSPNGSLLTFAYLDKDSDADNYQGWNLTRVYVEEIGNFPNKAPIMKLMATLRSVHGVPVGFRATGNPGGPGHHWVKSRYIDPARNGWKVITEEYENPFTGAKVTRDRVFIPGKITDHTLLGDDYIAQLQMSGSETLVRAWLLGDWDAIEGAFFDCWSDAMITYPIASDDIPNWWTRFTSFDWGSASPFSHGWWCVSDGTPLPDGRSFPRGAMVRYREWYGAQKNDGSAIQGLKLSNDELADGILARETEAERKLIKYRVADPSIFIQSGGPSIGEQMASRKVIFQRADNRRVGGDGPISGWAQMRNRMLGTEKGPMIYCTTDCADSIRTIPVLQHDETHQEDLDTDAEDHAADEWRYACMSRPWVRPQPKTDMPIAGLEKMTMDRMWKEQAKRRMGGRI